MVLALFECQIKSRGPLAFDSAIRFGLVFVLKHKIENMLAPYILDSNFRDTFDLAICLTFYLAMCLTGRVVSFFSHF